MSHEVVRYICHFNRSYSYRMKINV
jgi:hypothetical protein